MFRKERDMVEVRETKKPQREIAVPSEAVTKITICIIAGKGGLRNEKSDFSVH